jgi:hypothetical protein
VPSCANGHEQDLGLNCRECGSAISYREATKQLLTLPTVKPDFGRTASLHVGVPRADGNQGYSLVLSSGEAPKRTADGFELEKIQGGTWHDYYSKYAEDFSRWLKVVAFGASDFKFLFADATNPLSVLAVSALPQLSQTALVAITADEDSTPMEQNTTFVAVSVALKRGIHVVVVPHSLARPGLSATEGGQLYAERSAFSQTVGCLLAQQDGLMDLLERDSRIGVGFHLLSPILAGSTRIYGKVSNAFLAQTYQLPRGAKPEESKTFHALISCEKDLQSEFEKGFSQFRSRRMKGALSAECKLRERAGPHSFDLLAIYGLSEISVLQDSLRGYNAVAKRAPVLKVGSVA